MDVSIIIPTLDEAKNIGHLIQALDRQSGNLKIELLIVDGGSSDNTIEICQSVQSSLNAQLHIHHSQPGRATQMNKGAQVARGADLLFLHADSTKISADLLKSGKFKIDQERKRLKTHKVAGHFGLNFDNPTRSHLFAYCFYESKTRLNKLDCINGDQGFWLARSYFIELKKFDISSPIMEDTRLAEKIFSTGQWITLPGTIKTSARRFESEGFWQRQVLNSFLRIFNAIKLDTYFTESENLYQSQNRAKKLYLASFFVKAHQTLSAQSFKQTALNWYKIGNYVASNIWQVAFVIDCFKNYKKNSTTYTDKQSYKFLFIYERWLLPIANSIFGRLLITFFSCIVFYTFMIIFILVPKKRLVIQNTHKNSQRMKL